jgi:hypothetical protein
MAGGRPLKFATPQALEKACDEYFADCEANKQPFTITGLALALDTSRETLCNYEEKDAFFDTVKRAKLKCENYAEKQLYTSSPTGPIFALKNYGWKDKQETEHSGTLSLDDNRKAVVERILDRLKK